MKNDINKIQVIENYLDGEMSNEEIKDFEKELNINEQLRKDVEIQKDIRKAFIQQGKEDLKNELDNYYNQKIRPSFVKRNLRILIPVMSAAASIIIIIFIYTNKKDYNNPSDQYITLDSAGMHKEPEYADSAVYQLINDSDSIEIMKIDEKDEK